MAIIYKVINKVNNKIYIGQTIYTLNTRKIKHISSAFGNSPIYFHRAIRKYGVEQFEWSIIWEGDQELLNEMEIYFIKQYNSFSENGYNLSIGGGSQNGFKHTDETKKKLSERQKGVKKLHRIDKNLYFFINIDGREEKNISRYDMIDKYDLCHNLVSCVINGSRLSTGGWKLKNK